MTYTITITDDKTQQAKSLLKFLKSLSSTKDYNFLIIEQDNNDSINEELMKELEYRYEHFKKNKESYKEWNEIKGNYLKK